MSKSRNRRHVAAPVFALTLAVALVAGACSGGDDGDANGNNAAPSRIVVAAEELPGSLNMARDDVAWTPWITQPALARGYRITPDFEYEPWVFAEDCTEESGDGFSVTCTIDESATWSDGQAITAADFEFSYETLVNPDFGAWATFGAENITDFTVNDDTSFTVTFDEPYAAWRDIWASGSMLMPSHLLADADLATLWDDCICDPASGDPIGSGPYLLDSFTPGEQVTLTKNDAYWDGEAKTDEIVFVSAPETETQVNDLEGGDADVIYPQPTTDLRTRLEAIEGVQLDVGVGFSFEQLGLLTTAPGLDDIEVRRAIATALPRNDVVGTVVHPVDDSASVWNNSIYMTNQDEYLPNWDVYPDNGDAAAAEQILDAAGWTRDGDGPRAKGDVTLSFAFGTTPGDAGRELAQQIIQDRLGAVGIELVIDNADDFFDGLDAGEYPFALFGGEATPDPASWVMSFYHSSAAPSPNTSLQSNEQVDALLEEAVAETDADARAGYLNAADRIMAESVIGYVPLFQKPAVLASKGVNGLELNVSLEGFTWNIENWERTG